jgi:hypothetical protein
VAASRLSSTTKHLNTTMPPFERSMRAFMHHCQLETLGAT